MNLTFHDFKNSLSNHQSISDLSRTYAENNFKLYLKSKASNKDNHQFDNFNQEYMNVLINLYVSAYKHINDIIINNKKHENIFSAQKKLSLHTKYVNF